MRRRYIHLIRLNCIDTGLESGPFTVLPRSSHLDSVVITKCNLNKEQEDQGCKDMKSVFHVSSVHPTKSSDPGQNRRADSPPGPPPDHQLGMWGNICSAINITIITHCLFQQGGGTVRGKHFHLRDT